MINNDTFFKLLSATAGKPDSYVIVEDNILHLIPENKFSPEEIEELRDLEKWRIENGNPPTIANFLPDDIRPPHVKKL